MDTWRRVQRCSRLGCPDKIQGQSRRAQALKMHDCHLHFVAEYYTGTCVLVLWLEHCNEWRSQRPISSAAVAFQLSIDRRTFNKVSIICTSESETRIHLYNIKFWQTCNHGWETSRLWVCFKTPRMIKAAQVPWSSSHSVQHSTTHLYL